MRTAHETTPSMDNTGRVWYNGGMNKENTVKNLTATLLLAVALTACSAGDDTCYEDAMALASESIDRTADTAHAAADGFDAILTMNTGYMESVTVRIDTLVAEQDVAIEDYRALEARCG